VNFLLQRERGTKSLNYFAVDFDCWLAWGMMRPVETPSIGGLQTPKNSTLFLVIHSFLYVPFVSSCF
jgi:hypothetical protein